MPAMKKLYSLSLSLLLLAGSGFSQSSSNKADIRLDQSKPYSLKASDVSGIPGHPNSFTVLVNIWLCDTTWAEYTVVTANGVIYPIEIQNGFGFITIELTTPPPSYLDITVYAPGNDHYILENVMIYPDMVINIPLSCTRYPTRNLTVDPVSLHTGWDPPQVAALDEDFEPAPFPPAGWQAISDGSGWFKTTDGSSAGWNIPYWFNHYACTNDLLAGNGNNGSYDYLISPVADLRYRFNNFLSFYSYFDGSNGEEAFVEYSFDGSDWATLYQLEPSTSWEKIELDLSAFSGPEGDPVWFAFHADDNGLEASGWAVDSIRIYSPEPPRTLLDYWVFLNDTLVGTTDSTFFDLSPLTYGQEYSLKVKPRYPSGLGYSIPITFTSYYLYPPPCFYQADTGNRPLIICPPLDSTGAVPFNLLGYNLYFNGDLETFLPFGTTSYDPSLPPPVKISCSLTGVYDLTPYGYEGETGESMEGITDYILRSGFPLPFLEQWNFGTFETNNWTVGGPNWSINGQQGNPDPSAEFTWDPIQENYEISLESNPLLADSLTAGQIYLDFDLKLTSVAPTGYEHMLVQVWDWESQAWSTVKTFSNEDGSFSWTSEHLDITDQAMDQVFKIRFLAQGENSINILGWLIDNINVYRVCNPPENLEAHLNWDGMNLSWEKPAGTGFEDQWIHWDDGEVGSSIFGGYDWSVAARWTPEQLVDFEGASITTIAFVPGEVQAANYRVRVWSGELAANLLSDQEVISPVVNQWNYITLNTPVPIDITQELWVGYQIHDDTGYPAGCDDGPAIDGYGNWLYWSSWQTLLEVNPDLDFNWSIQAFIIPGIIPDSAATYAIYRSDDGDPYFLRDFSVQNYYLDDSVCELHWYHEYKVTALYVNGNDTCESDFSNIAGDVCEGVKDISEESFVRIYPNPSNAILKIESAEDLGLISFYNSFGELMLKMKFDERQVEIPIAGYPAGVYMIRVETGKDVISRKIVVMH
jgi:hypothetical protein